MIKRLLMILFILPVHLFAVEVSEYKLTPAGIFFMVTSWVLVLVWNFFCFKKILSKK